MSSSKTEENRHPAHPAHPAPHEEWPRRRVLAAIAGVGTATAVFGRAFVALAKDRGKATPKMIRDAEWIAGVKLTEDERKLMLDGVNDALKDYARLRAVPLDNGVPPAIRFDADPLSPSWPSKGSAPAPFVGAAGPKPATEEDLAFSPVSRLAPLLRDRVISSVELTGLYLNRLRRIDPKLQAVVTLTPDLAMRQAEAADREIAAGLYRGPLHGVPWGAKDLLAVPGYPTTWGATPYRDQVRPGSATVVKRLEAAGAVLVAKLSLGALAWGDVWFGGTTKNPWNLEQGSSGSSAGSASAVAAGLVGFAIGTETWGSIVSPCTRCGSSGLRPTFGRVSRHGAMALAWTMDKIGPIARSAEDCGLIFHSIHGSDGLDPTAVDRPFAWPGEHDLRSLAIGYTPDLFDEERGEQAEDEKTKADAAEWAAFDRRTLETLRGMGVKLVPIELPSDLPIDAMPLILTAEASTAFDELTRSGMDDLLVRQEENAWPNVFRQGQLIPAVEYLRASRIRTLLMRSLQEVLKGVDLYVSPSFMGNNLLMTNLTGHPSVVVPNGFRSSDGTPTSITFTGRLWGEADLLTVARAYQEATDFHLKRPPLL